MKIDYTLKEVCYIQGYRTLKNKGIALLGMSPGNPYFKQSTISELLDFSADIFSTIYIVVPDKPSEHTFKAFGYSHSKARSNAQKKSNNLKNRINRSIEKISVKVNVSIHLFGWQSEIEQSPHYQEKLQYIYSLYKTNKEFYNDVNEEIKRVIETYPHRKQFNITENMLVEGAQYLLKEIAFCIACPRILQANDIAIVYHREWVLWEKFSSGHYNKEIPEIGFVKIS